MQHPSDIFDGWDWDADSLMYRYVRETTWSVAHLSIFYERVKNRMGCMDHELKEVMDEEDGAAGLQFSIDVELNNYKLNDKQRAAVRKMHMKMLVEVRTKMQLLVPPEAVRVRGEVRSSATGKREVHPDAEAMNES